MTHNPKGRDKFTVPDTGAGKVLLHWLFVTLLMTALIGGAALLF